jgi:transcriptional regulator with XRE-family HTH domain
MPPLATTTLGAQVREARERLGLTVTETARRAGVSQPWLSDVEVGRIQAPGEERLKKLAHALELDPLELLEASGRLTAEQQLMMQRRPSFSEFVHSDPRLDRQAARALVALYLHYTGGRE